jgi:beta-N-acetylhexosaminidase
VGGWRELIARVERRGRLPLIAAVSAVAAIGVVASPGGQSRVGTIVAKRLARPGSGDGGRSVLARKHPQPWSGGPSMGFAQRTLRREVGQVIIATYAGEVPPPSLLADVQAGRVGAIILMGDNTVGGDSSVGAATSALQRAAAGGGNPRLLIMTDQEGGEVARLSGPPAVSAQQMGIRGKAYAYQQGVATGQLLSDVGINVDLAPVADVDRVDGFIEQTQRSFGSNPQAVARDACAFARGLESHGVAYTLKHFPGLGDAINSTDGEPVRVTEPLNQLTADDAAYRRCGHDPLALVMVSSASYAALTGNTPAVESPLIYNAVFRRDGITALPISDSFQSGAIDAVRAPARNAIDAGLDMVMYPGTQSAAETAYGALLKCARDGALSRSRLRAAYERILQLKKMLR